MSSDYSLKAYDYHLPQAQIAQSPATHRDTSRLLVLDAGTGAVDHREFSNISAYLRQGDLLVINDTRVFPARLFGHKESGGKAEVFLLNFPEISQDPGEAQALALIKSSKRPRIDSTILIGKELTVTIVAYQEDAKVAVRLNFPKEKELATILETCGQVPLPPYISREGGTTEEDRQRYQTVYADAPGAVAAPTAGLHFTEEILATLRAQGVDITTVTLHVGYGTFAPVRHETITDHTIHREYVRIPQETVDRIARAKGRGGRIWAVGTTTVRTLEFGSRNGSLEAMEGWCDLYICPGYTFRVVDNLITNFHLPQSSLMFLVSALCGRKRLLACYEEAIREGYRFYSYGDAMAVITKW